MKLRAKTLLTFAAAIIIGIVGLYLLSSMVLLRSYKVIEDHRLGVNIARVVSALEDEQQGIQTILGDWAHWDDTLNYIKGTYPEYVADNLMDSTFTNLGLNGMLFVGPEGRIAYHKTIDLDKAEAVATPPELLDYISHNEAMWKHPDEKSSRVGMVVLPLGPVLMASLPILNSDAQAPPHGAMIMVRYFNAPVIENLARKTHLTIVFRRYDEPDLPEDFKEARGKLDSGIKKVIEEVNDKELRGYRIIPDIEGDPALILRVEIVREIYQAGARTNRIFIGLTVLLAGGLTLLVWFLIDQTVIKRLSGLSEDISNIRSGGDLKARVAAQGKDEINDLADEINTMLTSLEGSHSELQKAYDDLQITQKQLIQSAKMASLGVLAAGVAHELSQPLMLMRGHGQLMKRKAKSKDEAPSHLQDLIDNVEKNTKRMMTIIDGLKVYSRQAPTEQSPVNLNQLLENSLSLFGEQLNLNKIQVDLNLATGLPRPTGNANQLQQVFLNLITNSKDSIELSREKEGVDVAEVESGSSAISIETRLNREEEEIEILVSDTGPGIPTKDADHIFDPFFTTKGPDRGTGLGLSISYGIVKDHGGVIELSDTGPSGTTFTIKLPVEKAAGDENLS